MQGNTSVDPTALPGRELLQLISYDTQVARNSLDGTIAIQRIFALSGHCIKGGRIPNCPLIVPFGNDPPIVL
jgi:hypothetical protein